MKIAGGWFILHLQSFHPQPKVGELGIIRETGKFYLFIYYFAFLLNILHYDWI